MKKTTLFALVALPVIAYTAASAWLGQRIEHSLDLQAGRIEGTPNIRLVQREYERGVFSATETVTIELFGDNPAALPAFMDGPIMLTVRSHIRHGPWIGGSAFAAGVADAQIVPDAAMRKRLTAVFGDRPPLDMRTVYAFAGGGRSHVSSPAFKLDLPGADGESGMQVTWEGVVADIDFSEGMQHYTTDARAPGLQVTMADGSRMTLAGLRLTGDQQRMFDDDALMYSGTQRFTLDTVLLQGRQQIALRQLVFQGDMPVDGDFVDVIGKIGADSIIVGGDEFGPAHYDFSLTHLHARTAARLYRAAATLPSDPAQLQASIGQLAGPAIELLGHGPRANIDRLGFNTPHGPAHLDLHVALPGATPDELASPAALIGRIDARGTIALPEALLRQFGAPRAGGLTATAGDGSTPEDAAAMADAMFEQQLAAFAEQGYITRENGQLRTEAAFSGGQLTFNGKPFNRAAMQP